MRRQLETESPGDPRLGRAWPLSFWECRRGGGDPGPPSIAREHLSGRSHLCALRHPTEIHPERRTWLQSGGSSLHPQTLHRVTEDPETTRGPEQQCRHSRPLFPHKLYPVTDNTRPSLPSLCEIPLSPRRATMHRSAPSPHPTAPAKCPETAPCQSMRNSHSCDSCRTCTINLSPF